MDATRRRFLGLAGGLLLGGAPAARALAGTLGAGPEPTALKAARWAMAVDVRRCIARGDCRACAEACHRVHNVPEIGDPEEEIRWIWKEPFARVFADQAHGQMERVLRDSRIPILCNHCERPACVRVCPTRATWKRDDGIVTIDMHRCIGCRYCMAACPYGSRSFNFRNPEPYLKSVDKGFPKRTRGVVEKCNFCEERLAAGRFPACVEACREIGCGALRFGDLKGPELASVLGSRVSLLRRPELGTEPRVYYIV